MVVLPDYKLMYGDDSKLFGTLDHPALNQTLCAGIADGIQLKGHQEIGYSSIYRVFYEHNIQTI